MFRFENIWFNFFCWRDIWSLVWEYANGWRKIARRPHLLILASVLGLNTKVPYIWIFINIYQIIQKLAWTPQKERKCWYHIILKSQKEITIQILYTLNPANMQITARKTRHKVKVLNPNHRISVLRVWAKCMRLLDSALPVLYSIPPNIFCGEVPNDKIIRVLYISLFAVGILKKFWHFPIPCRCNTYCFHIDTFQYFGPTSQSSDRKVFRVSSKSQSHFS